VGSVLRHEGTVDDNIFAAGSREPRYVPVVGDLIIGARQEEGTHVWQRAIARRDAAEENPLAVVAAARERPTAGDSEAALDALHFSGRRVRRADQDGRVFAPDILLRLLRKESELPVVDANDAKKPRARRTGGGDFADGLEEGQRTQLEASPSDWLKRAQQTGLSILLRGFIGESSERLARRSSAPDGRH
jgi:hypothetical protein